MADQQGPPADGGEPYLSCPSAQPDMEDARVFGVVTASSDGPRVAYLKRDAEVGPDEMAMLGEVDPIRVFRFSGKCESGRCGQFDGQHCGLAKRIAEQLAPVVDALPSCQIRPTCRWYHEVGAAACMRCPQVVTLVPPEMNGLRAAATGAAD
jgi:hypothetical protein